MRRLPFGCIVAAVRYSAAQRSANRFVWQDDSPNLGHHDTTNAFISIANQGVFRVRGKGVAHSLATFSLDFRLLMPLRQQPALHYRHRPCAHTCWAAVRLRALPFLFSRLPHVLLGPIYNRHREVQAKINEKHSSIDARRDCGHMQIVAAHAKRDMHTYVYAVRTDRCTHTRR